MDRYVLGAVCNVLRLQLSPSMLSLECVFEDGSAHLDSLTGTDH